MYFDKWSFAVLIIVIFVTGIIAFVVMDYYENTIPVEVSSKIVEKYIYEDDGVIIIPNTSDSGISVGMPTSSTEYVIVLEDGTDHNLPRSQFVKYRVGDFYTYTKRVPK